MRFAISAIISFSSLWFFSVSLDLMLSANSFLIKSNPEGWSLLLSKYGEFSNVLAMSRAIWGVAGLCIRIWFDTWVGNPLKNAARNSSSYVSFRLLASFRGTWCRYSLLVLDVCFVVWLLLLNHSYLDRIW